MLESWSMKKILTIVILGLVWSKPILAGTGASCELEVDKAQRSKSKGTVTFEVYNPTDKAIIVNGVKYYKSDTTFWREYSDIYKVVPYKRSSTIIHYVNIPMDGWRYVIQCSKRKTTYIKPKKNKSGAQKWLDKIRGN